MNAGSQVGYSNVAAQPVSLPVTSAQNELDSNIAQLHEALAALRDRLGPVLGSSKPQSVDGTKGPQATPTVANRIYSSASAVRQAREAVGELLDRLEI